MAVRIDASETSIEVTESMTTNDGKGSRPSNSTNELLNITIHPQYRLAATFMSNK
jgi:hypothetical protein